jgi:hypothetical protein
MLGGPSSELKTMKCHLASRKVAGVIFSGELPFSASS